MKTQRSRAQAEVQRAISAPIRNSARPLLVFPGEAPLQPIEKANARVSGAWRNAAQHVLRAWKKAAQLVSCAEKGAKKQIVRSWKSLRAQQIARSGSKRLQVAATVSLGEKRFVAVIKVDGREFLVGGGATNVALLAQLDAKKSFKGLLTKTMAPDGEAVVRKQPAKRLEKKMVAAVEQAGEEA